MQRASLLNKQWAQTCPEGDTMPMAANLLTKNRNLIAISGSAALVALLVLGAWFAAHRSRTSKADAQAPMATMSGMAGPSTATSLARSGPATEPQIDLAPDDLKKAQIRVAQVIISPVAASLRTPGTVKVNEYTEVHVTPLVGGLVKQVPVVLGDHVRRGQPLAVIFSGDLAEAETAYLSNLADYEADHKKLDRTQALLKLGAASQQEEEEVAAAHAGHKAHVQASREKLELLGASGHQIATLQQTNLVNANLVVPAPISGVVLTRTANLGLVATPGQELFTIADLSNVWVLASVNEKDFASVRVGSPATITASSYPGRAWKGRVAYLQPQVDPATRTTQARIEVANLDERLRIDMYVDVDFSTDICQGLVIPQSAVQAIGEKEFVFLPVKDSEGSFTMRQVKVGPAGNGNSSVLSGLKTDDQVVTEGSFILKAEAVRQHPELQ